MTSSHDEKIATIPAIKGHQEDRSASLGVGRMSAALLYSAIFQLTSLLTKHGHDSDDVSINWVIFKAFSPSAELISQRNSGNVDKIGISYGVLSGTRDTAIQLFPPLTCRKAKRKGEFVQMSTRLGYGQLLQLCVRG